MNETDVVSWCENCGKVYIVEKEGGVSVCFDCMYGRQPSTPPKTWERSRKEKR